MQKRASFRSANQSAFLGSPSFSLSQHIISPLGSVFDPNMSNEEGSCDKTTFIPSS
jgi:hypothetical protein